MSESPRTPEPAPDPGDAAEAALPDLDGFRRHIESLRGRLDALLAAPEPAVETSEALEATVMELRAVVELFHRAGDALRESRAEVEAGRRRYRDIFELAPDPYLVTDLRGVVREANRAAAAALNIDHGYLVGKPLIVFLPEEGRPAFRSVLTRLPRAITTEGYDLRLKPRGLPPFDAEVRVAVVRDPRGQPVALRWTARDVSERRRAEDQIRALNARLERRVVERSEQLEDSLQANERLLIKAHAADAEARPEGRLFRDLVEEVDAILWRADAETGRYTFVSRRAEELLGYPAASWLDDPDFWSARIHPEDRDWTVAHRRKQLRDGADHEAEYRVVAADGRTLWFRESVRILRQEPGRPAVLYGLMVNISKRKKVERQLYTAKGELAMQLRDMTYLHELGGRLATARGWRATLDEVLSAVASLQGTDMGMVLIRDRGGDGLALAASLGLPEEFAGSLARGPLDPSTLGLPIAAREPVVVEDAHAVEAGSPIRQAARLGGFRALFGVPLFTREGEFLGAIATLFRAPYRPPERQARLVEMYAEHAAEAIEAAGLLDRLEEAGRRSDRAIERAAAEMKAPLAEILAAARSMARDPEPARHLIERQALQLQGLVEDLIHPTGPAQA